MELGKPGWEKRYKLMAREIYKSRGSCRKTQHRENQSEKKDLGFVI